jgi:alpha-L-fucosidase 2
MKILSLFVCTFFSSLSLLLAQEPIPKYKIPELKNSIYDGVFTGNGLLGTMTYQKSPHAIQIDVGRTDVYDHRQDDNYVLFRTPRLPIGHFEIVFDQEFKSSGAIDMNKAEASAYLNNGIEIRTISLAQKDVILIFVKKKTEKQTYTLHFIPSIARSPRFDFGHTEKPKSYIENPSSSTHTKDDITLVQQPLLAGGGYVTAYRQIQKGIADIYAVTVAFSKVDERYVSEASEILESVDVSKLQQDMDLHQDWWKSYQRKSAYSIPDTSLQAFYAMQLYKLASATRADKPALDLQGPWTSSTPWPGYWYNLNMQLTYSPLYTANRLDLASSLIKMIDTNKNQLIENVHPDYRYNSAALGRISGPDMKSPVLLHANDTTVYKDEFVEMTNLTWLMYYYYQHYRHSMDESMKQGLYDLLKRSVNYNVHLLRKNSAGHYEFVVKAHSPEYPKSYDYNTNYDLSNLRWGLKTLQELGGNDKRERKYLKHIKEVEANLIAYPVDKIGLKISSNQSYDVSHRHYSHLMMIYPYYMMNAEHPENIPLIKKSIEHWQSKKGALQGYSLSGAASMYAMMGDGDKALEYLHQLHNDFIQPNTLYKESGPVIETPLSMAQSLHELSLQYWNGVLRIFPAIPSSWKDVSFENFLTDGAFLISAKYENGQTKEVTLTAQHDGEIKVKTGIKNPEYTITGKGKVVKINDLVYSISLSKGSRITFLNN